MTFSHSRQGEVSMTIQQEVADLRIKAREGTMTVEDARRAITILRADRLAMPQIKTTSRSKKAEVNADDLLGQLGI